MIDCILKHVRTGELYAIHLHKNLELFLNICPVGSGLKLWRQQNVFSVKLQSDQNRNLLCHPVNWAQFHRGRQK